MLGGQTGLRKLCSTHTICYTITPLRGKPRLPNGLLEIDYQSLDDIPLNAFPSAGIGVEEVTF
jgi:hypothetical protein